MSKTGKTLLPTKKSKAPWILLLLLLATVYLFFILPRQMGPRHVDTQFEPLNSK